MRYSTWQRLLMPVLLVSSLVASCGKDNPAPTPTPPSPDPGTPTEVPLKTQRINRFIVEAMRNRYLWNSGLPSEIDITSESDPAALFKRLRNPAKAMPPVLPPLSGKRPCITLCVWRMVRSFVCQVHSIQS